MSFFELFDQFFQLNAQQTIAPLATKLYMYWLHEFNQARWPAVLYRRANQVYIDLEVDKKSLERATAQLVERGLLRHIAGTKTASGTWHLNYGPAAEWQAVKGNNSPQHEGNYSPQDSEIGPFSGGNNPLEMPDRPHLKGNFSPPIRNRQDQNREDQTKGGCETAEEITPAPLPAEKEDSAPRCEAPPQNRGSVELPVALATEAKQLATTIGQLWKISEITNYTKWARIAAFTKRLAQLGQLAQVTLQFAGYKLQREKAGLRPHSLDTWLGTYVEDFANGEWCGCDWAAVAADTRTRPGEAVTTAVPARAATSPTKARTQSWN